MIQLLIVALTLIIQLCGSREAESASTLAKLIIAHAANNSPEQ